MWIDKWAICWVGRYYQRRTVAIGDFCYSSSAQLWRLQKVILSQNQKVLV